jgi:ABC-2 type transport system ATP-binding protein
MIVIENLQKSFGSKKVLNGLCMTVQKGEVFGFLGENGAGKTTTMNIITGLLDKDGGSVKVDGAEVAAAGESSIGYLPESPEFFEYMTCFEYFKFIAAACQYSGDIAARSREILALVGLSDAANRKIKGFSRGMKQRVGIGCALYSGKQVIILDEPTSALDPQGRADVIAIIQNLKQMGKTVVLSTHILSDVERVADRIGILHGGRVTLEGKLSDLLTKSARPVIGIEFDRSAQSLIPALQNLPFIADATASQNRVFVTITNDFDAGNRELFRFIAQQEILVRSYQVSRPTLEQIYLQEVGKHVTASGWNQ